MRPGKRAELLSALGLTPDKAPVPQDPQPWLDILLSEICALRRPRLSMAGGRRKICLRRRRPIELFQHIQIGRSVRLVRCKERGIFRIHASFICLLIRCSVPAPGIVGML